MNRTQILYKIVEENGSCNWARPSVCAICPLSKLKRREDGGWYSCLEAVGAIDLTEEEANHKYKLVAANLLLDDAIDNLLGEEDGTS